MDELWIDFSNSLWHDWKGDGHKEDRLLEAEWQAEFLNRRRLTAPVPAAPEDLEELRKFRDQLRRFAEYLSVQGDATSEMVEAVNGKLQHSAVIRRVAQEEERIRIELTPQEHTWNAVLAEVAASFAQTLADGSGSRVRICDNTNCKWVFLDDTRNRSKRFCDDKLCGNLMKVRRFRERKKSETK